MRLSLPVYLLACALACQAAGGPLTFFKNYFVTGDHVAAGVGLSATGSGTIQISGIPTGADIVSAFLYWQTIELREGEGKKGTFRGYAIEGKALGNRTSPCWSSGGATGAANGAHALRVYRTDVMRYLPALNGVRIGNGSFPVSLPHAGSKAPITEGASLVVVYRHASMPLRAVVIYDGAFTLDQGNPVFEQRLEGFYEAATTVSPRPKLTHIVGDGQPNFGERLVINQTAVYLNPFAGNDGAAWDTATFTDFAVAGGASDVTTRVDRQGLSSYDCLSWGALVLSVDVQDTDNDGLLDTWERNGLVDISNGSFLNLKSMGADPNVKDVFVEIDYMKGTDGHSHAPLPNALQKIKDAFAAAPVPIRIHFDTGQGGEFKGGNAIDERTSNLFPGASGVVGWKFGYRSLKVNNFAHNRKDVFRYVIFGHALGLAVQPPTNPPTTRSTSGIADLPGADILVTLGLWQGLENPDTAALVQAGTLMHELGHTFGLRHGGDKNVPGCKPNYQSVMNYLFQVRGLTTSTGAAVVDYSRGVLGLLNEAALVETGLGTTPYSARWYAPPGYLDAHISSFSGVGSRYASRHCDGSPVLASEPPAVKVDSPAAAAYVDWNNDGKQGAVTAALDINFSGVTDQQLTGYNDWSAIDLRQIGARRNARGLSGDIASGDIASGDVDYGDIASGDIASGDIASGDIASGDIASGDIASGIVDQLDVDYDTAASLVDAPSALVATADRRSITLRWTAPAFGVIGQYNIYRVTGAISPTNLPAPIGIRVSPGTTFTDADVRNNVTYQYFVTASNPTNTVQSPASNVVTITK